MAWAKAVRLATLGAVIAFLAGCSADPPSPSASTHNAENASYLSLLDVALKSDELDPQVRQILEATQGAEQFTFEELRQVSDLYVDCLTSHGLIARAFDTSVEGRADLVHGVAVPSADASDQAEGDALLDTANQLCKPTIWDPAAQLYASQPSSLDLRAQHLEEFRTALIKCLRDAQFEVADDVTADEIVQLVGRAAAEQGVNCQLDTGYLQDANIPPNWWDE